jgi:ketosteroid isomerase-like protein
MSTRDTVERYFGALKQKQGWESFLAEDMVFTSLTSPVKRVTGKAAYLETTKRFYGSIETMELRKLIVEGENACAVTHYRLGTPQGPPIETDVAEILTVKGDRIHGFDICFDSAPFPK